MGNISKNFNREEFACGHCGRLDVLDIELVRCLQRLRDIVGKPLVIVSGYRCCAGNRQVGGVEYSQHLFGRAADIHAGYATARQCRSAGFSGVGIRSGKVVHVDLLPLKTNPTAYLPFFTFPD